MLQDKLKNIVKECEGELRNIGIPFKENYYFLIFPPELMYKNLGTTWKEADTIAINEILFNEKVDKKVLKQVVIHELLHTCEGTKGHNTVWKNYAKTVNEKLGYNISTYANFSDKEFPRDLLAQGAKYALKCEKCGAVRLYKVKTKTVNNPENSACRQCGGNFKRIK